MSNSSPFFVVGSDRSGSTMLRLMLNEHPELHIPPETHFIKDLMDALPSSSPLSNEQVQNLFDIATRHERWDDLKIDKGVWQDRLFQLKKPSLGECVETLYTLLLSRTGKTRWGDKTPDYVTEIDRLHVMFPSAQFIHIIRDGRDVCLSLLGKKWHGSTTANIAHYWSKYVSKGINSGKNLSNEVYLQVYYEDLVLHTEDTLKKICTFLSVEYDPRMLSFHENAQNNIAAWEVVHHLKTMRPPESTDVHRWQRESTLLQLIVFEAIAGRVLELAGYQRRYKGILKSLLFLIKVQNDILIQVLNFRKKLIMIRNSKQNYHKMS